MRHPARHARAATLLAVLATAAIVTSAAASSSAAPVGPPAPILLDRGWTLRVEGGPQQRVSIPHVLDPSTRPANFAGESGVYRLSFTAPSLPPGFHWALRFEQVRRTARVTLNGTLLAVHTDPYVPFTLPARSLRAGAPNELVVAVDTHKDARIREGWWNWGGITRAVQLVPEGPLVLHDPGIVPQLRCRPPGVCSDVAVRVDGTLENTTSQPQQPTVTLRLDATGGGQPTVQSAGGAPLAPGERRRITFTAPVTGTPELWSPDHPYLYRARLDTRAGSALAQVDTMRIGLRQVAVQGGHLLVNGRRVELRGASIQEDIPGHGPALTDADIDEIMRELRAVHANVTRAHYLLDPRLLARLDAGGIMVWTQAPIYHRDALLRTPAQRAAALATLRGTVLGARSHPSTLVLSVGNELSSQPDRAPGTSAYLDAARGVVADLAPDVPVGLDVLTYPGLPYQRAFSRFDALGINDYYGWYLGKPDHSVARLADLAPYLRTTRARYPRAALVITEYGAEASQRGPADRKQTYAFQSRYIRRTLGIVRSLGFVDGTIYWTLREFAVKPFWDGLLAHPRPGIAVDSIHRKGLIRYDGRPKPAFAVAARVFAAIPLYRAAAPRSAPDEPGSRLAIAGALLGLLALAAFDVWCFAGVRRRRRARRRAPRSLGREAHRDHVAVGHDVVAAFEA